MTKINKKTLQKSLNRCKELVKPEHANWIGLSNQEAIQNLITELNSRTDLTYDDLTTVYIKGAMDSKGKYETVDVKISEDEFIILEGNNEVRFNKLAEITHYIIKSYLSPFDIEILGKDLNKKFGVTIHK